MIQALQAAVVAEALRWVGTPYHHLGDVHGAGVDCAMLLVRVYAACGLVPPDLDPRPYAPDWHLHKGEELYRNWVEQHATLQVDGQPEPGDVMLWRFGRAFSHAAIVTGYGRPAPIVHALRSAGAVVISDTSDPELQERPCLRYRLHAFIPAR